MTAERIVKRKVNMYDQLASSEQIEATIAALQANGINGLVVESGEEAKKKVLELLPEGTEVMTMTSVTLDTLGIAQEINESGKYDSVRVKLNAMNRETQGSEMQKLGAAPDWTVGSVHAVTEDGKVLIASNTGSQLPAYAYGAGHVVWVVGAQKIVKDVEAGLKRIYDYVLPLEAERAKKAYGAPGSFVSKLLVINRENIENRITIIFIKEVIGY